jgi:replicative DNA helicase
MKTLTSARFAVDFYELTKDQHENPEKYRGWSYGLDSLTKALGGIRRNQFILLGGAQKSGKSTMGLNVAAALGKQGVTFLWISLEMKHEQMGAALFSNIANIERKRFRDIELDDGDWEGLRHAVGVVSKWPGFWNSNVSPSKGLKGF